MTERDVLTLTRDEATALYRAVDLARDGATLDAALRRLHPFVEGAPVDPPERVSQQDDTNEYRPWEIEGITELELGEASALRHVRKALDLAEGRPRVNRLHMIRLHLRRALEDTKGGD